MSSTKKTWVRPTQLTKSFPSKKYYFDDHLKKKGDWLETNPMTREEYLKFKKAVCFWSWRRGYRIKFVSWPVENGAMKEVRVTLTALHRERDYD